MKINELESSQSFPLKLFLGNFLSNRNSDNAAHSPLPDLVWAALLTLTGRHRRTGLDQSESPHLQAGASKGLAPDC